MFLESSISTDLQSMHFEQLLGEIGKERMCAINLAVWFKIYIYIYISQKSQFCAVATITKMCISIHLQIRIFG